MEEDKKKDFYKKWWFWLIILIIVIVCIVVIIATKKATEVNNYNNSISYIDELRQNYNNNIKLKENPYETTNQYDGVYNFLLESDNGSGHIFNALGVIAFDNGKCKIKYECSSDTIDKITKEFEGFCGLNKEDNSTFYFTLNDDKNYQIITYKCKTNEKNLSCELKSTYDLAGCTNNELDLIYIENQNFNELDNILSQIIEEQENKKIEEEKAKKDKEEAEFKETCKIYTYEQMARNPENFKGTNVKVTGEVIQAIYGNFSVDLRINITKKGQYSTYYTDTIYVTYIPAKGEDKILEGDIVTVYGTSQGDYTYTSTMGAQVTLPLITAKYVSIRK